MSKTINSKQMKFSLKPIPKVNQTCMFFDDGKISYSRMYQATVKQVMVYNDAPDKVKKAFERESKTHDWIWNKTTDYIVACEIKDYDNRSLIWFARTVDGGWFSMDVDRTWQGGRLDIDGELEDYLVSLFD